MSNEDKSRSNSANSEYFDASKKASKKPERKTQTCGRCKIHGLYIKLNGHKPFCRYQNCDCPKCPPYLQQKDKSRQNIAVTRAKKLVDEKKLLPEEVSLSIFIF